MDADQVRALVAAKWPNSLKSPLAVACASFAAADEADRVVGFADMQARVTLTEKMRMRAEAAEHAQACLAARGGWTVETLGHNIESAFGGDLDSETCDQVAREALARLDK